MLQHWMIEYKYNQTYILNTRNPQKIHHTCACHIWDGFQTEIFTKSSGGHDEFMQIMQSWKYYHFKLALSESKYQWMDFVYMEQRDKVKLVNNSLQTPNLFLLKMVAGGHLDLFSTQIGQIHQTTSEMNSPYPKTLERTPYMPYFEK